MNKMTIDGTPISTDNRLAVFLFPSSCFDGVETLSDMKSERRSRLEWSYLTESNKIGGEHGCVCEMMILLDGVMPLKRRLQVDACSSG